MMKRITWFLDKRVHGEYGKKSSLKQIETDKTDTKHFNQQPPPPAPDIIKKDTCIIANQSKTGMKTYIIIYNVDFLVLFF